MKRLVKGIPDWDGHDRRGIAPFGEAIRRCAERLPCADWRPRRILSNFFLPVKKGPYSTVRNDGDTRQTNREVGRDHVGWILLCTFKRHIRFR